MIAIIIIAANGIRSMIIIVIFALLSAINRERAWWQSQQRVGPSANQLAAAAAALGSPLLNRESNQGVKVSNNSAG